MRLQYDLYCVGWGVKLYSLTQMIGYRGLQTADSMARVVRAHTNSVSAGGWSASSRGRLYETELNDSDDR